MALDVLWSGLQKLGLSGGGAGDPKVQKALEVFWSELEFWNPKYGLVNSEGDETLIRHFLDSAAGVSALAPLKPETLADIGSGAGFPGVVLAVFLPQTRVTLVEKSGKRCRFLENLLVRMGLDNVELFASEAASLKSTFDVLTTRGYSALNKGSWDSLRPHLADSGTLAAYKGKKSVIQEELHQWQPQGLEVRIEPLSVPYLEEERHLVLIKELPKP